MGPHTRPGLTSDSTSCAGAGDPGHPRLFGAECQGRQAGNLPGGAVGGQGSWQSCIKSCNPAEIHLVAFNLQGGLQHVMVLKSMERLDKVGKTSFGQIWPTIPF